VFEKSQTYVALSRCPDPNNMQVINFDRYLVMVDEACVLFYITLSYRDRQYAPTASDEQLSPHEHAATGVAGSTVEERWGSPTADTAMMLGQMSISDEQDDQPE
jgi:hypothetical protein